MDSVAGLGAVGAAAAGCWQVWVVAPAEVAAAADGGDDLGPPGPSTDQPNSTGAVGLLVVDAAVVGIDGTVAGIVDIGPWKVPGAPLAC